MPLSTTGPDFYTRDWYTAGDVLVSLNLLGLHKNEDSSIENEDSSIENGEDSLENDG